MDTFRCGVCETSLNTGERTCTYRDVHWEYFYPNCRRTNWLCSAQRGAWVPAITVCSQRLWV